MRLGTVQWKEVLSPSGMSRGAGSGCGTHAVRWVLLAGTTPGMWTALEYKQECGCPWRSGREHHDKPKGRVPVLVLSLICSMTLARSLRVSEPVAPFLKGEEF